ncbi:Metalloendoproteinase 1 [Morella rubra]|uniref:Metalloendoproteinase 1 n=1 Tax=Morella rubra TaxID=262757 RepID=A0A6A1UZ24_9ROSI|nr:Metalloendoproteinase 1 [Morella rubra]
MVTMNSKAISLFSHSSSLVLLPLLSCATSPESHDQKKSAFEFLKHLQGCHHGEKVKGIHDLKKYLEHFGYLSYSHSKNHTHANDDDFDELLESAVKTYQRNYHLNATGTLDAQTVSKMMMPRCGVADIINDEQWSVGARPGAFDLETVALHEIGHLLGLGHSSVEGAIMFSSISQGVTKGLHADDIQGIKALYNT